eukprot:m.120071 g.120071  ORF g.120071 m.120071 type:complete len:448 (+) comp14345_c0_seq2:91-1434(+)
MEASGVDVATLTPFEAETYAEQLEIFNVKNIGSPKWLQQHEFIEKLNIQAHVNAQAGADEFVQEALISFGKIPVLVHELIAIEVWKENVYPELVKLDFCEKSTMVAYIVFYHEATLVSLLEAVLFHKEAVESLEDAAIDLADYCYRQITFLNSMARGNFQSEDKLSPKELLNAGGQKQLEDQINTLPFDICTKAVSIMFYLLDNCKVIPLGCLTRILNTHDTPCGLASLLLHSPWNRKGKDGDERYVDGRWMATDPSDKFKLTKTEAQVWMSLFTVLMNPDCRSKYRISSYNKEELIKLRGKFNDILLDQIPALNDLRRALEELALMEAAAPDTTMILEQLPEIREHILKVNDGKWGKIAKYQKSHVFCSDTKTLQTQAERLASTYDLNTLEALLPEDPKCAKCGELATMRCSRCKNEWYCRRQCQVQDWKKHKQLCNLIHEAEAKK